MKAWIQNHRSVIRIVLMVICIIVFIVCIAKLAAYGIDLVKSKINANELRSAYHANPEPTAYVESSPVPYSTLNAAEAAAEATPDTLAEATSEPEAAAIQPTKAPWISDYPNNPYRVINSKFDKLRRQNSDICAWITVNGIFDDAVVQRDNSYYLTRDYKGAHNSNGAIFLDENCSLITRPCLYVVYGHNMKTGAMFGSLRNWENISFYHANPFIQFDTIYEDGEFVIFAVGELSVNDLMEALIVYSIDDANEKHTQLSSFVRMVQWRSVFTNSIDVNGDDQILLLVTCTNGDDQRRILCARRIRENESKESLKKAVQRARKQ